MKLSQARKQRTCQQGRSFFTRGLGALSVVILFSSLTACVATKYPPAPRELSAESSESFDYIVGEGDILNIFVWGYDELSDSVPVRPDGQITTRLVEDLQASGRTTTDLAREIETRYSEFVKKPVVTVSVNTFVGSASQQVKVLGASSEPRTVPYTQGMMLLDVIIAVGGMTEFANGNGSTLVRKQGAENVNYSLQIDDLVRKGDVNANVPLLPGDIIIIPESRF